VNSERLETEERLRADGVSMVPAIELLQQHATWCETHAPAAYEAGQTDRAHALRESAASCRAAVLRLAS
jgi:hypothetical protein